MEKGYGFGAEGDWKVAAMVRLMKIMTAGKKDAKGTSMLEDYTYNLMKGKEGILEAHMLEICPSIADGPISIKCQPLTMGDREDPARLVFTSKEGTGIATSLVDLGDRFRLITQVQRHGYLQEEHIIQRSHMTLLLSRWASGQP